MSHSYTEKPQLPYSFDALAPHISQKTLEFHYGKHHMAYYNKMQTLCEGKSEFKDKTLMDLVKGTDGVLFNQAAQTYNHSFYWASMKANPKSEPRLPTGTVAKMIDDAFGSYDAFKEKFSGHAAGHFGSGWVWLVLNEKTKKLEILETHDADCPHKGGRGLPILACDVWEHAYYLDYQNARPEYVKAWWNLINFDFANENLKKAGL
eukprot:Protomagalhaensia_wolfi_Nauph_80__150@NODE_1085_length_1748_cov_1523_861322_g827_i0_p1_GENE_NODE_1085_length_1748_cov_1523_861322_g827_i0NODE_1085_length_1748_cov_1523_861322_g827_i0_p1_ORF_typecomplete_len206_score37_32Sod_Fe_C/PF02777_18/8_1e37Sod_Fe_N/PF00081_22/1_3e23Sod_Fe_N/PF00081_22/6_3e03_NODE_1085_length_1748_cov_1523_861322_g827_i0197814